mmetsp:Transcript_41684/g.42490  ORF Transcript_41684/g.42490 Transcript_41684/m.42490 type:complete len:107 (+) Transcript_41684:685-1005(+)
MLPDTETSEFRLPVVGQSIWAIRPPRQIDGSRHLAPLQQPLVFGGGQGCNLFLKAKVVHDNTHLGGSDRVLEGCDIFLRNLECGEDHDVIENFVVVSKMQQTHGLG